jgi:hypothetical protein
MPMDDYYNFNFHYLTYKESEEIEKKEEKNLFLYLEKGFKKIENIEPSKELLEKLFSVL